MKRLFLLIFFAFTMVLLMQGCYYDKFQELHPSISTGCDSSNATYSVQVAKIINTYCIGCHSGASASGGIMLDNYNNVKAQATSGLLMNALKGNGVPSMPPNTHLDDCKIGTIQHWIRTGMPNN
jgi:mono/diheme cytochrome c family protein